MRLRWVVRLGFAWLAVACGDPVQVGPPPAAATQALPSEVAAAASAVEEQDAGTEVVFNEENFVETEANRDPFRNFAELFQLKAPAAPQRAVLMPTTGIDQMRLIAIISGTPSPRAMLTDPSGVGHVVQRGDYLGRAEVVQAGGPEGMPVTLNWRVDRIRSSEIVLTREDPTAPDRPPLSRVIPLHEETSR